MDEYPSEWFDHEDADLSTAGQFARRRIGKEGHMNRFFALASTVGLIAAFVAGSADAGQHGYPPGYHRQFFKDLAEPNPDAREIKSDLCATTTLAEAGARRNLARAVKDWLAEGRVDPAWTPPRKLVDRMVIGAPSFEPVKVKELDVVRATITADFSEHQRREILKVYRRHVGGRRLAILGGGLGVVLVGLAAVSGFIRADEATKGYYTTRLRLLAAAGVGAAGVVAYHILT